MVENTWRNPELSSFILTEGDGFWSNIVRKDYTINGIFIPRGMKLVKAFKYFEHDPEALDQLQTKASMLIQEDKVSGKLCFSVHPLDFLSASENDYNWRSCHALDGDYRTGNLSYITDSSTFMVYLKGHESARLPNFPADVPWNSKKWRCLFFLSDNWNVVFAGRQYPFMSADALDYLRPLIAKYLHNDVSDWSVWHDEVINTFPFKPSIGPMDNGPCDMELKDEYVNINGTLYSKHELIKPGASSFYFNDLLDSTCYKPYYMVHKWKGSRGAKITIGGPAKCIVCGKDDCCSTASMFCKECELEYGNLSYDDEVTYCTCCGNRMFIDDAFMVEGQAICEACHSEYVGQCEHCHQVLFKDHLRYNRRTHQNLCFWCDRIIGEDEEAS